MKKKIIGIFVCTLLIGTTLTSIGMTNEIISTNNNKFWDFSEYVAGEFIVKFKEPLFSSVSINYLNEKYQVSFMEKLFINSEGTILDNIYIMKVPEYSDILSIVNDYSLNLNVEYAESNGFGQIACGVPNDADFSKQWALDNFGQTGGIPDADIDAPETWDITTGSSEVVIAVIDSGIDYTHSELEENIWINENEIPDNDIDDDNNGFIDDVMGWDWSSDDNDPLDEMGHGTVCAGLVGAVGNNGIGIAGVCWNCKIMPLKIMNYKGVARYTDMAESIQYAADNGADIISMSFGLDEDKSYIKDAVNYAFGKGSVLVAACGNDGTSEKTYPVGYDNVIAVAATNHNDSGMYYFCEDCQVYHSSNYGPWVDVAAPGQAIYSTMPTYEVWFNELGASQNYEIMPGGTSWAGPHVAGVAALLLSRDSSLSPEEVKNLICENIDPYDSEYYIGTGRLNAYKALSALNTPPNKPTITGEGNGKMNTEYKYKFRSIDPEGDNIEEYFIDWGDESGELSIGPYPSGVEASANHTWSEKGDYTIKVKARDILGAESNWSTFEVSMPKTKVVYNPVLQSFMKILECFPVLNKILSQIISIN